MRSFLVEFLKFLLICILCFELFSRIFIDPLYFYSIDTYNLNSENNILKVYGARKTPHVDYLFIGSSRVPATINPAVFVKDHPERTAIVAGRGYTTPGLHYQALKNRIAQFPQYLDGAYVFLEYPGASIYETSFQDDEFTVFEPDSSPSEAMPHLLLPYLTVRDLFKFLRRSNNSTAVKIKMIFLFSSSTFRTSAFIRERLNKMDKPIFDEDDTQLVSEGGIRNDHIDAARKEATENANQVAILIENNPILTKEKLDESSLFRLFQLIQDHGGILILYTIPLHSVQENIYTSDKAQLNHQLFDHWIKEHGIKVLRNEDFIYNDSDFPDAWHLSKNRRDEFTSLLYRNFKTSLSQD